MKKSLHYLFVAVLAVGLAADIAWSAKPEGKGKPGGGGGGSPDKLDVIADFLDGATHEILDEDDNVLATHPTHLRDDDHPEDQYDNTNVGPGWVNLPGTGNFTMSITDSNRQVILDISHPLDNGLPFDGDATDANDYTTFITNVNYAFGVPITFMSINQECDVDHFNAVTGLCSDPTVGAGSLRELREGDYDLVMRLGVNGISDGYDFRCGPLNGAVGYNMENADFGTTPLAGRCVATLSDGSGDCAEWKIAPYTGASMTDEEFNDPGELRCNLFKRTKLKGNSYKQSILGQFDLRFGLTVKRDTDGDGTPDLEEQP